MLFYAFIGYKANMLLYKQDHIMYSSVNSQVKNITQLLFKHWKDSLIQ